MVSTFIAAKALKPGQRVQIQEFSSIKVVRVYQSASTASNSFVIEYESDAGKPEPFFTWPRQVYAVTWTAAEEIRSNEEQMSLAYAMTRAKSLAKSVAVGACGSVTFIFHDGSKVQFVKNNSRVFMAGIYSS